MVSSAEAVDAFWLRRSYQELSAMPDEMQVNIGYIPLTDCAALVVAREFGIFARHGLRVRLKRETSWANLRDGIVLG